MPAREDIRNVAIIAHVDHGKTTLVDQMLRQSGIFRANEQVAERVMDSNDIERERGITILSKNTAVKYGNARINIVDTPGHADFGGEVERILMMVDGVLLLVDAFEGCMPQTRFVLKKALGLHKKAIVVINKLDRPGARPAEVVDEILDLFIELGADENQLDFPVIYASGRDGYAVNGADEQGKDMQPLFDAIMREIPAPIGDTDGQLQLLISSLDYDDYVGRIGIGRIERGEIRQGQQVIMCRADGSSVQAKIATLYQFEGLRRVQVENASMGDIVAISGVKDLSIGDTACAPDAPEPLPFVRIDEPTVTMSFLVNDSPFAGQDGKYITSRNLRDRLYREIETNVALRVNDTDSTDTFEVSGRGELHLSILIEQMRRQGYEFAVSRPEVIYKEIDGKKCEPIERLTIDVSEEYVGSVMSKLGLRRGEMVDMNSAVNGSVRMEFRIPSRTLMGYRSEFLTDTRGNGIMNQIFDGYEPFKGEAEVRTRGSIIAHETGEATSYGLYNAQERGDLFIPSGVNVYEGMVVGVSAKNEDLVVNVCKKKHVSNIRASGSDDALKLTPPVQMSLERCIEFIADDELVEVTPQFIRMRKRLLNKDARAKRAKAM